MSNYVDNYKKRIEEKEKEKEQLRKTHPIPEHKPERESKPLPVVSGPKESVLTAVKKEIEKDYNNSFDFLILPRHIKFLKNFIIILAFLLVAFLLYRNFISAEDFHYNYDINQANFLSPNYRISNSAVDEHSTTYRNLTSSLVYFTVPIPRGAETVKVDVKFKSDYNDTLIMLGAKDREDWHYQWKTLYTKPLENLENYEKADDYYVYKMNKDLEDIDINEIENQEDLVLATNLNLRNNPTKVPFSKFTTTINNSLRGGHTFYIYTEGNLYMEVKKQDLNWYNGSDKLIIELSDSQNNLLYSSEVEDDGIKTVSPDRNSSNIQTGKFEASFLSEGVYKLEFKNFDGIIRQISINTDKIVVANNLYLADSNIFFTNMEKNTTLYTESNRNQKIIFKTWHNAGFQNLTVNSNRLEIKERVNDTVMFIQGNTTITSTKNDIILSYPGYFAFSKESYFEPYTNRIIQIKNNKDWQTQNVDYLILDYKPPVAQENGWTIGEVEFHLPELYYKDKLSLVFNTPHLSNELLKNQTVQIDYINVTIHKPGVEL